MSAEWFWVREPGGDWFPAFRDPLAAGGWTNGDTWENFGRGHLETVPIPRPDEPETAGDLVRRDVIEAFDAVSRFFRPLSGDGSPE